MSNSFVILYSFLGGSRLLRLGRGGLDGRHKGVLLDLDVARDGVETHVNEVLAPLVDVGLVHVEDVDLATGLLLEHLEQLLLVLGDVLCLALELDGLRCLK